MAAAGIYSWPGAARGRPGYGQFHRLGTKPAKALRGTSLAPAGTKRAILSLLKGHAAAGAQ